MKMNEVTQTEASAAGMGMGMMIPAALLAYPLAVLFDKILPGESSKEKDQRIKDEVAQISSDMKANPKGALTRMDQKFKGISDHPDIQALAKKLGASY